VENLNKFLEKGRGWGWGAFHPYTEKRGKSPSRVTGEKRGREGVYKGRLMLTAKNRGGKDKSRPRATWPSSETEDKKKVTLGRDMGNNGSKQQKTVAGKKLSGIRGIP